MKRVIILPVILLAFPTYAQIELESLSKPTIAASHLPTFMRACKGYIYNHYGQVVAINRDGIDLQVNLAKYGKQDFINSDYGSDKLLKQSKELGLVPKSAGLHFTNRTNEYYGGVYVEHVKQIGPYEQLIDLTIYKKAAPYDVKYQDKGTYQLRLKESCKYKSNGSMFFMRSKFKGAILEILDTRQHDNDK